MTARAARIPLLACLLPALLVAAPGAAFAQTAPDAGTILRGIESSLPPKPPPPPSRIFIPGGETPAAGDLAIRVRVNAFRIKGATLVPETELLDLLRDLTGRELSLAQIKLAPVRLAEHYREKGFMAKAMLPPQTIEDGIVDIVVIEARLGGVHIGEPRPERADAERAREVLLAKQPVGEPIRADAMLHGLRIVNETPGYAATAVAQAGSREGETDLLLKIDDTPLLSGVAMLDNHGARSTGTRRATASLSLNNPTGPGDQASLMLLEATGNAFARLGYSFPVGHGGARIAFSGTRLSYRLIGDLATLNADGWARLLGITATYPLVRSPAGGLTLSFGLDDKHFVNNANFSNTSDKRIRLRTLGASGDWRDAADGNWSGSANLVLGRADLGGNAADLAADKAAASVHGRFAKLTYSLSRSQKLDDDHEIAVNLSGQRANDNLDSGERFSLGGPTGVRAYPVGEASGDEGWLASAELRRQLGDEIQAGVFLEAGSILLHRKPWSGWDAAATNPANRYMLNGAGLTATWKRKGDFVMTAGWAMRLGNNPLADAKGRDSDGTRYAKRLWWQLTKLF